MNPEQTKYQPEKYTIQPTSSVPAANIPGTKDAGVTPENLPEKSVILIAEDNKDNYALLEYILKPKFQLIHAWDGREAIALFKIHQPALILMDIRMPETDGYEALSEIRKVSPEIPIVAVTAYAYSQDVKNILAYGFDDYIAKPIDITVLKEKIKKFLPQA